MNSAKLEALKEIGRWVILFVISWIITQILAQATVIPEYYHLKVWLFVFTIPVRAVVIFGLTMLGRYADKYKHEESKLTKAHSTGESMGILPF